MITDSLTWMGGFGAGVVVGSLVTAFLHDAVSQIAISARLRNQRRNARGILLALAVEWRRNGLHEPAQGIEDLASRPPFVEEA